MNTWKNILVVVVAVDRPLYSHVLHAFQIEWSNLIYLCREEIRLPLEALLRCEPARVKVSCGCGTWTRIKIFRFGANIQKIQATSDRIFLVGTTRCYRAKENDKTKNDSSDS